MRDGEAVLPHLVGEALALEDAAAGEADPLLDVGRAEHLVLDDLVAEAGREALDHPEDLVGRVLAEARVPVLDGLVRRRVLAEEPR